MKLLILLFGSLIINTAFAEEVIPMRAGLEFTECARQPDNTLDCKSEDASLQQINIKLISTGPGSPAMGSHEIYQSKGRYAYAASIFVQRATTEENAPYEVSIWFSSIYDGDPKSQRIHVLGGAQIKDINKIPTLYFNAEDLEDRGVIYGPTVVVGPAQ